MANIVVFEDGKLIQNMYSYCLWDGKFSRALNEGAILKYIESIAPDNCILVIPSNDGHIIRNENRKPEYMSSFDWTTIQPYIDKAKETNRTFILGVLAQCEEEADINYLYLPLDDGFFEHGIENFFPLESLIPWTERSDALGWRGVCSGTGGSESLRIRFTKTVYDYNSEENVRLIKQWNEGKNIPEELFNEYMDFTEFLKYKIFFIVDGNVIASNHMWGFASGCIPFLVSNGKCWFTEFAIPFVHYIPINHDLSNLIEQIEWVKNNDAQAKQIAKNALEFSRTHFTSDFQKKYIKDKLEYYTRM